MHNRPVRHLLDIQQVTTVNGVADALLPLVETIDRSSYFSTSTKHFKYYAMNEIVFPNHLAASNLGVRKNAASFIKSIWANRLIVFNRFKMESGRVSYF